MCLLKSSIHNEQQKHTEHTNQSEQTKARWTLSLPQTSRANPVQCYSTHQEKCTQKLHTQWTTRKIPTLIYDSTELYVLLNHNEFHQIDPVTFHTRGRDIRCKCVATYVSFSLIRTVFFQVCNSALFPAISSLFISHFPHTYVSFSLIHRSQRISSNWPKWPSVILFNLLFSVFKIKFWWGAQGRDSLKKQKIMH